MSGFQIPNTTPVPNEIINGWAMKLKGSELKVLLIIVRQTLGWVVDPETGMRKEEDWMNYSQIGKKTGLASQHLSGAIDALYQYQLIEIRDKEGNILNTKEKRQIAGRRRLNFYYRLNIKTIRETSSWFDRPEKGYSTIPKNGSVLTRKVGTTKHTLTKHTLTKTSVVTEGDKSPSKQNPELKELLDFSKQKGFPLQGSVKENRYSAHNLLKRYGLEVAMKLVLAAVDSQNKSYAPRVADFTQLYRKAGDLVIFYKREKSKSVVSV